MVIMKALPYLLRKEFRQIFRDLNMLRMIIVIPIVQLVILPLAADYEIKNISLAIVDSDHSEYMGARQNKDISSRWRHVWNGIKSSTVPS